MQDTQRTYIQCFCIIQTQQLSLSRSGDRSEKSIDKRVSTTLSIQITYVRQTNDDRVVQHPRHLQRARDAPCFAETITRRPQPVLAFITTVLVEKLAAALSCDNIVYTRMLSSIAVMMPHQCRRRGEAPDTPNAWLRSQPTRMYESETHLSEFRSCVS